jgi:hypothetical protein
MVRGMLAARGYRNAGALRLQSDGLEVPVIRDDLYVESCLLLLRRQGVIGSLTADQLRALGEMPAGPSTEIGTNPENR